MIDRLVCNRCNHEWIPRKDELPKTCPKCKSPYWNKKRVRGILLTKGKIAHVDDDLFPLIKTMNWQFHGGYASRGFCVNGIRKLVGMHRFVWEASVGKIPNGYVIHHVNGDGLDNRIENLRMLTVTENLGYKHDRLRQKTRMELATCHLKGKIKSPGR